MSKTEALWIERLNKAIEVHNKPSAKFFQVASVDKHGMPRNRTMVFRGMKNGVILAICDKRSEKVSQWGNLSRAELCWYFEDTREQFRLACTVTLFTKDGEFKNAASRSHASAMQEAAHKKGLQIVFDVWQNLSQQAQEQFLWPAPKVPIDSEKRIESVAISSSDEHKSNIIDTVHENFVLLMFKPDSVDYLNLYAEPQIRELHTLSDSKEWLSIQVNA